MEYNKIKFCLRALRHVTGHYSMLRGTTICYGTLQYVTGHYSMLRGTTVCYGALRHVTGHYSMLRGNTVCYVRRTERRNQKKNLTARADRKFRYRTSTRRTITFGIDCAIHKVLDRYRTSIHTA